MHTLMAAAQAARPVEDGLTFGEMIANLPHDPASIFVFVLLIVTFGTILWIGRGSKNTPPGPVL